MALAVVVLIVPLAQAGPGHEGPEPVEATMFIHFTDEDLLPMQPMAPSTFKVPPAADLGVPACGSALQWTAAFTQVPVDVMWTSELARDAQLGSQAAELAWFIQFVQPGTSDPLGVPAPDMRLRAELMAGEPGQGRVLGHAVVEDAPTQVDGSVHRFDVRLPLQDQLIAKHEGFHLNMRLDMGDEPCRLAPPGVRAYADREHLPRLTFQVFEPVRIDLLEPRFVDGNWLVIWHASSPWGRFDLKDPEAPTIRGPAGTAPPPVLVRSEDAGILEMTWDWDPGTAPNGTYRIDAVIQNTAGEQAEAKAVFQVGGAPRPQAEPTPVPEKQSPAPFLLPLLAVLVLRRVSR